MNFKTDEGKKELRDLIKTLAEKMHARGDKWLLKDSTNREDSWYNRHLRPKNKEKKEKVNEKESIK